jgi:branched-chain amino acid transport system permease protein
MLLLIVLQLINGLVSGMTIVMVAVGLSIIFGMLRIINFAHGVFYALGVYVSFSIAQVTGNFWLGVFFGFIGTGIVGVLMERGLLRRLYGQDPHYLLLLTFGLAQVIEYGIVQIWGLEGRTTNPPAILKGTINLIFTDLSKYRLFLIVFTAVLVYSIWLFLKRSRYGAIIRAGVEHPEMVECLGINMYLIYTIGFGLGVGLAAMAGMLMTPLTQIHPLMGQSILLESFVVVVLGGLGNFRGAVFGGIIVGEVISLSALISAQLGQVVIFVFMAIFLLWKPEGLFGGKGVV